MSGEETPDRKTKRSKVSVGIIGVVLTSMLVISALNMDKLPFFSQISTYDAYFDDAGGLVPGDIVVVAGIKVGSVEKVSLAQTASGMQAKVGFRLNDTVELGDRSRAAIKTETILGRRNLTLTPMGEGRITPGGSIPVEATVSPYSLSDALDEASTTLAETDTDQLNEALETMTETFSKTPANVKGAVQGVGRVSKAIADRDNALNELLERARGVTDVVGKRSAQIRQMLIDANSLLGELQLRREAVQQIITGTRDLTAEVTGFVQDNGEQLRPTLDKFNRVLDILNDNKENFSKAIDNLGPYANILGEAVSSGPYFSSLVGVATFGDYTGAFMRALQAKFPEAARYFFDYAGFPADPKNWGPGPSTGAPDLKRPTPNRAYPTNPPAPNGGN